MNLLERIKDYYIENRNLILASILSAVVIIAVIITVSYMRNDNNRSSNNNYLNQTTTKGKSDDKDKEIVSEEENTKKPEETSELSDLNFTLPEDVTEETQTTLKDSEYDYLIKVNRAANCVTVYKQDKDGKFTIPYKAMACSTGKKISNTPTGTFHTSSKYNWRLMVDGTYAQYATRIYNGILFHSVPCTSPSSDKLEYEEFNKLGSAASLGCVRLCVADAKWIYDNCSYGTVVEIYDDADNPGPLGKPSMITIPVNSPNKDWDPTDPDPNNPWNKCEPYIEASDITAPVGTDLILISLAKAFDTCGNDISPLISISGSVDTKKAGSYKITYSVTDYLGRSASIDVTVKITGSGSEVTTSKIRRSANSNTTAATEAHANTIAPNTYNPRSTTAPYATTTQETTQNVTTGNNATTNNGSATRIATPTTQRNTTSNTTRATTPSRPTTPQQTTSERITTPRNTTIIPTTAAPEPTPAPTTEPTTTVIVEPDTTTEKPTYEPEPTAPSTNDDTPDNPEEETTSPY